MSIQSPTGILNVTNATIRAGKVETTDLVVSGGFDMGAISSNADVMVDFGYTRQERKYPREKLEAASQNGYVVTSSAVAASTEASNAFIESAAYGFVSASDAFTSAGAATSNYSFNSIDGPWLKIQLANAVSLQSFEIYALESASAERISSGYVWASNDDSTWTQVATVDSNSMGTTVQVGSNVAYEYFALHVTGVNHANGDVSVGEWKLHGYEATGGDGQDLVLKTHVNAPSTDFLEIHYDANVSNSYPGSGTTLTDLSSTTTVHNGTMNNGVGFDSTDKALTFDGTNQNVNTQALALEGDYVHSVSLWVKPGVHQNALSATNFSAFFYVGEETAVASQTVSLAYRQDSLRYRFGSNDVYVTSTDFPAGEWVHVVAVYRGGGGAPANRDVYVNGVKQTFAGSVTASASLNLQTDAFLRLGAGAGTNATPSEPFAGSIANFRVHARPLLGYEVSQLYDWEKVRFGHVDTLDFTLTGGRVGLGTAYPGSTLDVRGDAKVTSNLEVGVANVFVNTLNARVGLGTNAPGFTLDVRGDANVGALSLTTATVPKVTGTVLSAGDDAVVDLTVAHDRESAVLRKYPEVALTSNVQAGYVVSASSDAFNVNGFYTWKVFNEVIGDEGWHSQNDPASVSGSPFDAISSSYVGEWLKIKLPVAIKLEYFNIAARVGYESTHGPEDYKIFGSSDDSNWNELVEVTGATYTSGQFNRINVSTTSYYNYYAIVIQDATNGPSNSIVVSEWELHGYEEDPAGDTSVDTTITSQFNTPDTTGLKLYLDGDKGSIATDYSGEGHTLTDNSESFTGNAWSFTSLATSNVTMSTGDLAMEGTHPHSVSMWFNCANVTSNATLFHVGTAAGEGDAKTAISLTETGHLGWIDGGDNQFLSANTWHNLVYATQGAGGVRTCYLDGRKLGDVAVQDTFGDYPPFAMTGYSQGGYTVSSSGNVGSSSDQRVWLAFNNNTSDFYSFGQYYDNSTGNYTRSPASKLATTDIDGNSIPDGEFLKLEVPHKLLLQYITMSARTSQTNSAPRLWRMYGSNDNINWKLLHNKTASTVPADTAGTNYIINASKGYKYFALVVTQNGGYSYCNIAELKYFGHKENDTTRFPISSTVLKYPHIDVGVPRDNPAKRGYVVTTGSSIFSGRTGARAFDDQPDGDGWETDTSSYDLNNSGIAQTGTDTFGSYTGHWIKLELPRKIVVGSIDINAYWNSSSQADDRRPDAGAFLGSNDDSTWELIHAFGSGTLSWSLLGSSTTTYETNISSMSASNTNAYKYIVFVITHKTYGGSPTVTTNKTSIRRLRYYGTEPEDVVARVGEGLDGRLANFRVYDKYIREEQALELWDAQKDQFGRAQSSVSVYRGHLGVGTTTPSAALTVMDEAEEMEEFPPRAMTAAETYMDGHGVFKASASSQYSTSNYLYFPFNRSFTDKWASENATNYNGTDASYSGTRQLGQSTKLGEWFSLSCPYKIRLHSTTILTHTPTGEAPEDFIIYASNDGEFWTPIFEKTGAAANPTDPYYAPTKYVVNATSYYKHFAIVVTKVISSSSIFALSDWRLFGTRERGANTLHDGQLTLTKNLTVPRIGPPLGADDTPRRDRLVVEYNTSTNPTENGVVKDTSGRGLDGNMVGVTYDATDKSFVSTASDGSQWIDTRIHSGGSRLSEGISGSIWVNLKSFDTSTKNSFIWSVGDRSGTGNNREIAVGYNIVGGTLNSFVTSFIGGTGNFNLYHTSETSFGVWTHVGMTYDGTNVKLYINGVYSASTTTTDVNIPDTNCFLRLNGDVVSANSTHQGTPMDLSNFKLYDVALTADEVKRLYDMGRCDEGHHVVNFSKTRVGIGLGDGEAPRGALDVRGETPFIGPGLVIHQAASGNWGTEGDPANMSGLLLTLEGETGLTTGSSYWNIACQTTGNSSLLFAHRGKQTAYIQSSNSNNPLDFTGQHRTFIKDVPFSQAGDLEGLIVSSDQNKYIKISGGIETGSNAIMINESLPVVSLSTTTNDKKCFGVISASEDPEQRSDAYGSFVTPFDKEKGDTRVYINSVGEGAIWVVNTNGSLESGDYITTSNIAGYGQKQDDDVLHNYTVAKITMDCDFEPATQPVQQILRSNVVETYYLGNVHKVKSVPHEFVTTTVGADDTWSNVSVSPSDVTYAEWSNLEANTQNTYTLTYTRTSNVVYDVKYTLTTTVNVTESDPWDRVSIDPPDVTYAEYSNLEANTQNTYTLTFTQTTTDEKTPEEWSALESNVQSLYNKVYYQSVEEEVAATWPGAVEHTRVTDRIENELDEHGQIQWEDHPTETEKAYKIRYLDANGVETDEDSHVYKAAFVGCTYHCG